MNYLIDTCVFSEYQKQSPEPKVIDWINGNADESLYISVLTIGELEKGILRLPGSKRKSDLLEFLETLIIRFDQRVLNLDTSVLRTWANLVSDLESKGRILPIVDSLLAATALARDLTFVTRNEGDFIGTSITILNPWK